MLKQLFLDGFSFENFIQISSQEEKGLVKEIQNNIKFSDENLERIKKINKEIFIVTSVETWCPFARVFSTTMNEVAKINNKIKLSFITMGRGTFTSGTILEISEDDFVVPTAIITDETFETKKSFIGYPEVYKNGFKGERLNYFKGEKTELIINEILEKIEELN
ncbi:MAG: hypothetical protein CR959_00410 [Fusobacteriales bacterium]|nr:MAG: hypothetical protein CR959_00410 [Fusobacteriales bacterium]